MAKLAFQAKVGLTNATPLTGDLLQWECALSFADLEGVNSGTDITVGDVLSFDTSSFETGTFTFYQVTSIVTPNFQNPIVNVLYMPTNDNVGGPPDLSYIIGIEGTIARPTPNLKLLPVVSQDIQQINDKYTEYVQNYNFAQIVDNLALTAEPRHVVDMTTGTIEVGRAVYSNGVDTVDYAANTSLATSNVIGLVIDTNKVAVSGRISGFTGLTPNTRYFLGLNGFMTTTAPTANGEFVAPLAIAVSTTDIILQIGQIVEI